MSPDALIGHTLSHYRIVARLGSGGMGDVYRAEDLRLRRIVALKTLRAGGDADEPTRRLLAEARAASALNHPHIAVVYEIGHGEHDGRPLDYIAMEFVEGTTLFAMMQDGAPDLDAILDIFEQIADALEEAERRGIVHRDLKPANVMVTPAGRVKVLDFGVAERRAAVVPSPDDVTQTADVREIVSGFVGTLPYAAPEQLTGRDADVRADLFSFGVMLYEVITGRRPFGGDNAAQVLESVLTAEVPAFPDSSRDPRLPALERLVRRMLARARDDRLPTAAGLRQMLASIRMGEGLRTDRSADAGNTIVVGGFVNISGSADDDWVGAGISATLTADAAQLTGVTIVPRERLSEILKTLRQTTGDRDDRLYLSAARELEARWLVSGGFQRAGDALRVTASLTDVASGEQVRSTKVDGTLTAIFELQDRLVRELAGSVRAAVSPATPLPETEVVGAYEAFSRGLLNRQGETFETLDRAVTLFERAVALDPSYARAHIELGVAYSTKADYLSMADLHVRALHPLRRATELQPGSARAWRELGVELMILGHDSEGMPALRKALALDPEDATVLGAMGRAFFIRYARFHEAADWLDRALDKNPKAGWYWLQLAHCAALLRSFERGERAAARGIALQEAFLSGREGLFIAGGYMRAGHLAALQGRHEEAVERFERELDFLVRTEHALRQRILVELNARLGASYLQLGDDSRAQAVLDVALQSFERRVRLGADDPFTRYYAAAVHALRGEIEPALALLERALTDQPAFTAARLAIEPEFERLRGDARFQQALARLATNRA
jgi:tetratricopeptide (TPR) repeat protein/TolB-like protein/predicted Ser/Thr protein kinase